MLIGNVEMPGTKEGRFCFTGIWANSIIGLGTFASGPEVSSSLTRNCAYSWRRANLRRMMKEKGKPPPCKQMPFTLYRRHFGKLEK